MLCIVDVLCDVANVMAVVDWLYDVAPDWSHLADLVRLLLVDGAHEYGALLYRSSVRLINCLVRAHRAHRQRFWFVDCLRCKCEWMMMMVY